MALGQHRAETRSGDLAVFGACEQRVIGLPEQQGAQAPELAIAAPWLPEPWLPERARILLVDDEPTVLELLVATLADDDYELQTAADGQEALEMAREWRPDLVLLDLAAAPARRPDGLSPDPRRARPDRGPAVIILLG